MFNAEIFIVLYDKDSHNINHFYNYIYFQIRVELTANHMGYFEFRLCPNNNPAKVASQRCLDQYILDQIEGKGPR